MEIYLSAHPEQRFSAEIINSNLITGIRCNTGAMLPTPKTQILQDFKRRISPIAPWVDLKCRELRIIKDAVLPNDVLELNHHISVKTPTALYYNEGKDSLIIDNVLDETKLVIRRPNNLGLIPQIRFGKGASINIPDSSLQVHEYLTDKDKEFIKAAVNQKIHNYLLSFVECDDDLHQLLSLDPYANIIAKIESKKGLEFVKSEYWHLHLENPVRLLAARGDLYIELDRPHQILDALKLIINRDPTAIAASRILDSFINLESIPRCADICDIGYLLEIGYRNFLLGDDLCENDNSILSSIGLLNILTKDKTQ